LATWFIILLRHYGGALFFTLDGLSYRFSGGYSLFANRPKTLLISAAVSLGGWFFFEYFDYFALGNWYYPNSTMPVLNHTTIQPYNHTTIQPYNHTTIQPYNHTTIQPYNHSLAVYHCLYHAMACNF
jgi:hypothetical protein